MNNESTSPKRLLTVWNRKSGRSSSPLLGPVNLSSSHGREVTSQFFTTLCGRKVICVVAKQSTELSEKHTHQFGNTSSGVKHNKGDTRTLHIINENTVRQFSNAIFDDRMDHRKLTATRFRPNIVVDNLEPWAEFDLVGKTMELVPITTTKKLDYTVPTTPLKIRIVSRTVRCAGVGIDPLHPEQGVLDIPQLLMEHYPEHGPYFGVYAVVEQNSCGGTISVGDCFQCIWWK